MSPASVNKFNWLTLKRQADAAKQSRSEIGEKEVKQKIKRAKLRSFLPPNRLLSYTHGKTRKSISRKISTPTEKEGTQQRSRQAMMSDICDTQNKPLITLTGEENYLRWKSYAMSELRQRGCNKAVIGRELLTVDSIKAKLIDRSIQNNQLKPNILINMMVREEEKQNLAISKAGGILSKLISNALLPIIEDKTSQDAWNALQERFRYIDGMSTSRIMYEATSKKLS